MADSDSRKRLLKTITKIISNYSNSEGDLGDVYELICRHFGITNKAEKNAVARLHAGQNSNKERKLIAIDFDGVLHSCLEGSYDGDTILIKNPPVPKAIKWLTELVNDSRFFVTIYSCRTKILGFEEALHKWLSENGMDEASINKLTISATKPDAFLLIDDRSWKFNGKFPRPSELLTFKAWYE